MDHTSRYLLILILRCSLSRIKTAGTTTFRVAKGGKFLEAPVSGSKGPAAAGALIFLAGGDPELYSAVVDDELGLMGKVCQAVKLPVVTQAFIQPVTVCVSRFPPHQSHSFLPGIFICKASFHFGSVGAGTKMKLVVNMTMGSMLTCLAEGAALAEAYVQ